MEIWRRVACWIIKATRAREHTHTCTQKYVTLIAFSRQQWLRERAPVLQVHCLFCTYIFF